MSSDGEQVRKILGVVESKIEAALEDRKNKRKRDPIAHELGQDLESEEENEDLEIVSVSVFVRVRRVRVIVHVDENKNEGEKVD